jgi:type IX secretion system PorP/SprF family membrane protein
MNVLHTAYIHQLRSVGRLGLTLFGVALWGLSAPLRAQNEAQISMYWAVPTVYNPATAGCDSSLHVSAFDRMQWVGVDNAPQTFYFGADMPFKFLKREHAAGVVLMNDAAGLFSTTTVGLQYAYKQALWGGKLSVGVQAGAVNQSFDGGKIYLPDGDAWDASDDALPTSSVSAMAFDCAAGAYYERGYFYGGLSAQHLTAATLSLSDYAYSQLERIYYFHLGGNIPVRRTLFIVQPSVLVKSDLASTQVDYTLRATYDHRFWGGLTLRPGDALVLQLGVELKNLRLGYAYDIGLSPLAQASSGSHELMVSYRVRLDLGKQEKHPHKSIRIL